MNDLNTIAAFVVMWGKFLKMMVVEHPVFSILITLFGYIVYRGIAGLGELASIRTEHKHRKEKK